MRRRIAEVPFLVILMWIASLAMLVPVVHALVLEDERVARAFAQSALLSFLLATMIAIVTHRPGLRETLRGYLVTLAGAYLVLPPMLAVPVAEAVRDTSFTNAWFEMVSCFTTTGATVYAEPGRLPETIHLWRAMIGWCGGLFFLIMAAAVLAPLNLGGIEVVSGRTPGRSTDGLSQIVATADPSRRLWRQVELLFPVYGGLTMVLWVLLSVSGEPGLVALIHAMSTLSTSGIVPAVPFAPVEGVPWGEVAIVVFLVLALSRRLLPGLSITDTRVPLWQDPELRLSGAILLTVGVLLTFWHGGYAWSQSAGVGLNAGLQAIWAVVFSALSFLTTTGFQSGQLDVMQRWSGVGSPGLVMMGLAIIGGGVATTAGGVKLLRMVALMRHGERELERIVHPNSVGGSGQAARRMRREGAVFAWVFFMLFAAAVAVVTAALTLTGVAFTPALILCLSALTLTGPLADVAGAAPVDWAPLPDLAKAILAATMVVGRLELLAVLALISPDSWRR